MCQDSVKFPKFHKRKQACTLAYFIKELILFNVYNQHKQMGYLVMHNVGFQPFYSHCLSSLTLPGGGLADRGGWTASIFTKAFVVGLS